MAGNFLSADMSMPDLDKYRTTDQKLRAIESYLFQLLESLRYTLRNLSMDNFNQHDLQGWVDKLEAGTVIAQTVVSQTIITNELYSDYGNIADLTVDELRTDYKRAQRYLAGDTSDLDYIHAHDDRISFITAETDGSREEQLVVNGRAFYWKDASCTQMTSEKVTEWPVMVYVYTEKEKGSFAFQPTVGPDGNTITFPTITLGVGSGEGDNAKAVIRKHYSGLDIVYRTSAGVDAGLYFRDDGFVDVTQRRANVSVDTANMVIVVKPEGTLAESYSILMAEDEAGNLDLTWPDGKTFRVEVL